MEALEAGTVALIVAAATSPIVLRVVKGRVVDIPNRRSSHTVPTPRGGGVAVILGVLAGLLVGLPMRGPVGAAFGTGFLLGVVGLWEDIRGLRISVRLTLQVLVSMAAVLWLLASLETRTLPYVVAVILAVFWLVGFTNAFNFMDGINGISAAQLIVAGLAWMIIGVVEGIELVTVSGAITAGSSFGFLPWNFPKARFFMGDVGSYFSGGWLAMIALLGVGMGVHPAAMLAPLLVYVADTTYTLTRRVARGEDWLKSHRSHVYQRLVISGWSHVKTTLFFTVVAVMTAMAGVAWTFESATLAIIGSAIAVTVVGAYLLSPYLVESRSVGRDLA